MTLVCALLLGSFAVHRILIATIVVWSLRTREPADRRHALQLLKTLREPALPSLRLLGRSTGAPVPTEDQNSTVQLVPEPHSTHSE